MIIMGAVRPRAIVVRQCLRLVRREKSRKKFSVRLVLNPAIISMKARAADDFPT